MTTPNRLQVNWNRMKPLILKKWDRLTELDLQYIDTEFDRLVDIVKQRYDEPIITVKEADIRQEVLDMLEKVEAS